MKIEIETTSNGYIVRTNDFDVINTVVFQSDIDDELETFVDLCTYLSDKLGLYGSRHDSERFYAVIAPGDKHESYDVDTHGKVLFGDDND